MVNGEELTKIEGSGKLRELRRLISKIAKSKKWKGDFKK